MIRRRSGYVSNPPGSGGGGISTQYKTVADGTEIGSSGRVVDGADNAINLTLPDGTAAAVAANGLSSLFGGCWWDLGSTLKGSIQFALEWVTLPASTHVVIAVWRDTSDPTTIQDIEDAGAHFVQILTTSTDRVDSTNTAATSGSWYAALLFGAYATVSGSDKVISLKLRGGMPL